LSKIISIGTAVPSFKHEQDQIHDFMQQIYALDGSGSRKLKYLYHNCGIQSRYSVLADYSRPIQDWKFYPHSESLEPFPSLEVRMLQYNKHAGPLSVDAIRNCLRNSIRPEEITHLITVSCTGMSAPGLDLQIIELMDLPKNIFRTSINFMGCYAAIHGLKLADMISKTDKKAKVMVVCTELCTLHFQKEPTMDNLASSLLFGDGSAAALVTSDEYPGKGLRISDFYAEILPKGKKDMAWELSSTGFQMTLSNYIPDLLAEDFEMLAAKALVRNNLSQDSVTHWCVHPGGKKILEAVHKSLHFNNGHLDDSYAILKEYGNMSSSTILFVLERIMHKLDYREPNIVFGASFGPGLTMETFIASTELN
jgi:predicted naringenin-chalcone synthase